MVGSWVVPLRRFFVFVFLLKNSHRNEHFWKRGYTCLGIRTGSAESFQKCPARLENIECTSTCLNTFVDYQPETLSITLFPGLCWLVFLVSAGKCAWTFYRFLNKYLYMFIQISSNIYLFFYEDFYDKCNKNTMISVWDFYEHFMIILLICMGIIWNYMKT